MSTTSFSRPKLGSGSTVDLAAGATVDLAPGAVVTLTGTNTVTQGAGQDGGAWEVCLPRRQEDAFGRFRVALPNMLIGVAHDYARGSGVHARALRLTSSVSNGTITVNTNRASRTLALTATNNAVVIEQTKEYCIYRAGQSLLVDVTFCMGTNVTNVAKRAGLFDSNDGIFIERDGTTNNIVLWDYTTGALVSNRVAQANWNVDTFGAGLLNPSGLTLDMTRVQIFSIDLQFLGVGRVRTGFVIDGIFWPAHEFHHSNEVGETTVYMRTPNLPIRWELRTTGVAPATTSIEAICGAVLREGGGEEPVTDSAQPRSAVMTLATNEWRVLLAFRLDSNHIRAQVRDFSISGYNADTTNGAELMLLVNPTLADPSNRITYGDVNTTSCLEYADPADLATRATATGGHPLAHVYLSAGRNASASVSKGGIPLAANVTGTSDVFVVVGRALSGTPTVRAAAAWKEYY